MAKNTLNIKKQNDWVYKMTNGKMTINELVNWDNFNKYIKRGK